MSKRKNGDSPPHVSEDQVAAIKVRRTNVRLISASTYKEAVLLRTEDATVWLTANEAERLGRALLAMATHRRRIDREEASYKRWMSGTATRKARR